MGEEVGSTGSGQVKQCADKEENADDDPEGVGDSVTRLAHRVNGQIGRDPVEAIFVVWCARVG